MKLYCFSFMRESERDCFACPLDRIVSENHFPFPLYGRVSKIVLLVLCEGQDVKLFYLSFVLESDEWDCMACPL